MKMVAKIGNIKIAVVIPVYITNDLHLEFTEKTIDSLLASETNYDIETIICVNYCDPKYMGSLTKLGKNIITTPENGVSIGWNTGINFARSYTNADYILIINNDILLHPKALNNLVSFAQKHQDCVMWTGNEYPDMRTLNSAEIGTGFDGHPHFSCFMIKPNFVDKMQKKDEGEPFPGYFDENFKPAYFEDGDMHNRILRHGFKAVKTASALFYHFGSRTIKSDDNLDRGNSKNYEKNREYFKRKWGFDLHENVIENDSEVRFKYKAPFKP